MWRTGFAAPAFRRKPGDKLRLAMLAAPCGVRAHAIRALNKSKIEWVEAFTGGEPEPSMRAGLACYEVGRRFQPDASRARNRSTADRSSDRSISCTGPPHARSVARRSRRIR